VPVVIKSLIFPASAGLGRDWQAAVEPLQSEPVPG
jgi:hypothetical protein